LGRARKPVPMDAPPDPASLSFEDLVARLDALAVALDDPGLTLDDALRLYEEGAALARHGQERLQQAEARLLHLPRA
jgi:exodeoxyribonuclease VII small subunit